MSTRQLAGFGLVVLAAVVALVAWPSDDGPDGPTGSSAPLEPQPPTRDTPVRADAPELERAPVPVDDQAGTRAVEPSRLEAEEEAELTPQPGARVTGQVVDRTGLPLAGHFLSLLNSGGRPVPELEVRTTDADGRFEYPHLPPGELTLWVGLAVGVEPQITTTPAQDGGSWVARVLHGAQLRTFEVRAGVEVELGRMVVQAPLPYHLRGQVELHATHPGALEQLTRNLRARLRVDTDEGTVHHARVRVLSEEPYGWLGCIDLVLDERPPGELDVRLTWGTKLLLQRTHWPGSGRPDTLQLGSLQLDAHMSRQR